MPLNRVLEPVQRFPLAGPQVADLAISDTMRRWDARMALLKRQPLVALAFHAIAIQNERCDNGVCGASLIAALAHEAEQALKRENVDLTLIDELYGKATCAVYAVRG